MKINDYPKKNTTRHAKRREVSTVVTNDESQPGNTGVYTCLPSDTDELSAVHSDRAEKIAALKHLIQTGNYQPDLERVAESLLKHIMEDTR